MVQRRLQEGTRMAPVVCFRSSIVGSFSTHVRSEISTRSGAPQRRPMTRTRSGGFAYSE